jgi:glycosyltransferase involved in cell wall biosynthesis
LAYREAGQSMGYTATILITTFQRPHLLNWGLYSLAKQTALFDFEIIVVNDGVADETEDICKTYRERLNIKYIFSGRRNNDGEVKWRVPGFALNIGAKQSEGQVLIITCAEMFSLNNTIAKLTEPLLKKSKLIGIPVGKDDRDGSFLTHLNNNNGAFEISAFNKCPDLNVYLPFLMSVSRTEFFGIGGYDEDFVGLAWDDNDFVERLLYNGCSYYPTDAQTIHLYHPRHVHGKGFTPEFLLNQDLYLARKGKIVRNENREWGKI